MVMTNIITKSIDEYSIDPQNPIEYNNEIHPISRIILIISALIHVHSMVIANGMRINEIKSFNNDSNSCTQDNSLMLLIIFIMMRL